MRSERRSRCVARDRRYCPRYPKHLTSLAAFLALALGVAFPALAKRVVGPCEWQGERCIRTIRYQLTTDEVMRLRDPSGRPAEPERVTEFDMETGEETRFEPVVTKKQAPQKDGLGAAEPKLQGTGLEYVDKPWNHEHQRTFVKLVVAYPSQPYWSYVCSGVMIGSHTVLTAGHCIYYYPEPDESYPAEWANSVSVFPAAHGETYEGFNTPFGEVKKAKLHASAWWTDEGDLNGDWGLIRLQENAGDHTDWADVLWDTEYNGTINFAGYPADEGYAGEYLYQGSGNITEQDDYLICHNGQTIGGMSGGPTWIYEAGTGERQVVGVVSFEWEGTGIHCSALYKSETDETRAKSEAVWTQALSDHWTCDVGLYWDTEGCDCDCGMVDPDCTAPSQKLNNCDGDNSYCTENGECACTLETCYSLGVECGPGWDDGCAGTLDCGNCMAFDNSYCSTDGECECAPDTCSSLEESCGTHSDGCGATIDCGSCGSGDAGDWGDDDSGSGGAAAGGDGSSGGSGWSGSTGGGTDQGTGGGNSGHAGWSFGDSEGGGCTTGASTGSTSLVWIFLLVGLACLKRRSIGILSSSENRMVETREVVDVGMSEELSYDL